MDRRWGSLGFPRPISAELAQSSTLQRIASIVALNVTWSSRLASTILGETFR